MRRRRRRSIVIALDGLGIDLVRDAMSSGTVVTRSEPGRIASRLMK
jgi:hypothetical protein